MIYSFKCILNFVCLHFTGWEHFIFVWIQGLHPIYAAFIVTLWVRYSIYDTLCYPTSQWTASNIFVHLDIYFSFRGIFLKWNYWIRKYLNRSFHILWNYFSEKLPLLMSLVINLLSNNLISLKFILYVYFC